MRESDLVSLSVRVETKLIAVSENDNEDHKWWVFVIIGDRFERIRANSRSEAVQQLGEVIVSAYEDLTLSFASDHDIAE